MLNHCLNVGVKPDCDEVLDFSRGLLTKFVDLSVLTIIVL